MRKTRILRMLSLLILIGCGLLVSCSKNHITPPPVINDMNLAGTDPIDRLVMKHMEGIYALSGGSTSLGTEFVCRISKKRLSFFSNENGIFCILDYGFSKSDSSIQFAGFWRYSENGNQGPIRFSIAKGEGARDLLVDSIAANIKLESAFIGVNRQSQEMTLTYSRPFTQYAIDHPFTIFAHHGVQTTAGPPYAENSLGGVLHDEDYGVVGLEFDVRLTKDHVPICIHDADVNTRLTLKGPLFGSYDQYGYAFLHDYVTLVDGQAIPSVADVLKDFIDSTTMKYMWLDIKGNTDIFKYMEPVVRDAYAHAAAVGRDVVIIADLPTIDVISEYQAWPTYGLLSNPLPAMCELTLQDVIENKCAYWGPRYSEGLQLDDVDQAHAQGIQVYAWTLNDKQLIKDYINNGRFDGMISDYPAYVNYYYYTTK